MTDGGDVKTCNAKTRKGTKCSRPAGWGTNHIGNGKCKLHGGKSTGPNPENMKGKRNAIKWGFWSKHVTPEQLEIMQEIEQRGPADILWENILLLYSAIIRAQKIMFVRDQDDIQKHLRKKRESEHTTESEWEFQYPWDRHASFMQSLARAMSELRSMIKEFLAITEETDERRLKLISMQADIELKQAQIAKLKDPENLQDEEGDGFMDALHVTADEVWEHERSSAGDAPDPDEEPQT